MILADTSIWIDHLRHRNPELESRLSEGSILVHPFVIAEIALGSLKDRNRVLQELDQMSSAEAAELSEIRHLIESQQLYSKGIGLTDAHLLASCLLTPGTSLWTRDADLARAARSLGLLFQPVVQ